MGVVFESVVPPRPHWTVREYLQFFAQLQGLHTEDHESLETLGLRTLLARPTGELSGGQRRRVEIARALAGHPPLLVLDEPTKELDLRGKRDIWRVLRHEVERYGTSILLSSHDILEIRELCSEVAVMRGGKLVQRFSPGEIASHSIDTLQSAILEEI